jgi:hypothetical protein
MASREVKKHLINEYRGAIKNSPVWVRLSFKAFLQLPNKYALNKPFLFFLLGKGVSDFKMAKSTAEYGLSQKIGQHCGNCIYSYKNIVKEKNICSHVRGEIETQKWCRLWEGEK